MNKIYFQAFNFKNEPLLLAAHLLVFQSYQIAQSFTAFYEEQIAETFCRMRMDPAIQRVEL